MRKEIGQVGQTGRVGCEFPASAWKGIKAIILACSVKFQTLSVSKCGFLKRRVILTLLFLHEDSWNTARYTVTEELMMDKEREPMKSSGLEE